MCAIRNCIVVIVVRLMCNIYSNSEACQTSYMYINQVTWGGFGMLRSMTIWIYNKDVPGTTDFSGKFHNNCNVKLK
jgi:hypothetical protein